MNEQDMLAAMQRLHDQSRAVFKGVEQRRREQLARYAPIGPDRIAPVRVAAPGPQPLQHAPEVRHLIRCLAARRP